MKDNYSVYIHIFPNGKKYIGITRQKVENRWQNGKGYKDQPIYQDILKYGWDNIEHVVLFSNISKSKAQELEIKLIKEYDSIENGYNISKGGDCGADFKCEFEYNGQIYNAQQLADISNCDLDYHDITNRINAHGWTIEKTLNTPKQNRGIKFEYNGKLLTVKELYEIRINKELTYNQIKSRLLGCHWDVERAITQPNNQKNQPFGVGEKIYEYNGQMYNSYELSQLSPVEGLTSSDITNRINHHGWDVEKAITQPKKKMNLLFTYQGKEYDSHQLAEICVDKSITYHDVTDRNRRNWTVEEIINIPKGMTKKQYYKNINQ